MTFSQILATLRARWGTVVSVFLFIVALAVAVTFLLPARYTATASVVVDFKPDPISAVMMGGQASPAFVATQVDVIKSERVALRVVKNLKLDENPQVVQQWKDETNGEGTIQQWLIKLFTKQLEVVPSRDSSVILVNYQAPDPRFAAGIANAFVQAYIQTALELRVDPARQYTSFFDTRAKEAREAVERAQAKLSEFQKENGIIATDERLDVETARLNELSSQVVMLQALAAESSSRQAQANSEQSDRIQEVLNNPLISQLKADISRSEAKLQELNTRYGEAHPQVREAKANLAELKVRLDAETRRVTSGVSVTNTINRQREAQIRAELEVQRAKVMKMKAVRDQGMVLVRESENAQRVYDTVLGRLNQTSLESQSTQSNVNVLTQASAPVDPSFPIIPLNIALGIVLGLLLGGAAAVLLEFMDRRLRSVEDAVLALDLPVIGVMPGANARGRFGRKRLPQMQQRLLAPLPPASSGT